MKKQKKFSVLENKTFSMESDSLENLGKLLFDRKYKRVRSIGEFLDRNLDESIYWVNRNNWKYLSKTKGIVDYDESKVLPILSGILIEKSIADKMLDCISNMCYSADELEQFAMEQRLKRINIRSEVLEAAPNLMTRPFEFIPWSFCKHSIFDMCLSCSNKIIELRESVRAFDDAVHRVTIRRIGSRSMY